MTNGHSIRLLKDPWLSGFHFSKVPILFDILAIDPGSTVNQFITHKRKRDSVKLASVFHPSLVVKIISILFL